MAPEEKNNAIRVGPAGWSYPDWKGIVYPKGMSRAQHPLQYLSQYFDTIEINSSFYHPPKPKHTAAWVEHVAENPQFMFTAKLWERFTHQRETWPTPKETASFQESIRPLAEAGKLGALLIQFPWSFKRTPQNRQWLARVIDTFTGHPLVLEVRHTSWDRPEVYTELAKRQVAFCNIDQPLFPNSIAPSAQVTAPIAYIRLHGQNHDNWFREDAGRDERYDYLYTPEQLAPWIQKLKRIREQAADTYAITNNHFRGQAIVNAFEIQSGLGKTDFSIPSQIIEAYPRLRKLTSGSTEEK